MQISKLKVIKENMNYLVLFKIFFYQLWIAERKLCKTLMHFSLSNYQIFAAVLYLRYTKVKMLFPSSCLKFSRKWEYIVRITNKTEKTMVYNREIVGMGNR